MKFVESAHKYIDDQGEYTPVTYFIKKFQPYVDWEQKCRDKAAKLGITYEELRKQWDEKRDSAANKGTIFHKMMEDKLISQGIIDVEGTPCELISYDTFAGIKEDSSMELEEGKVYAEKMIWSRTDRVCGTADLVQVINGKIHILDYKTNAKLDKSSWVNPRTRKSQKLLPPVSQLDDCNFNIYQLQLNTYMYMLLRANRKLKMGKMVILHIVINEDGTYSTEPHEVANLQSSVKAMFEKFKR